jgi:hypothetical protein
MTALARWLGRIANRLPPWARPAFFGAFLLFAVVAMRMVVALPMLLRDPRELVEFGMALVGVSAAGAVGGLCFSFIGQPLLRVAGAGPYLAGVAIVGGYMFSLLVLFAFIVPSEPLITDRASAIIFVSLTTFFGLVVGHQLRDARA